jgi:phage shock protein C
MNGRLYRSRRDRVIAGVAGGLADYLDIDPSIVRILWAVLTVLSGGVLIVVYILMAIIVPEEPRSAARSSGMDSGRAATPGGSSSAPGSSSSAESTEETSTGTVDDAGRPATSSESGWARPASAAYDADRYGGRRRERRGSSGLVIGLILIVLGAVFLLREYVPAFDWDRLWPVALIAVGVVLLAASLGRRRRRDWGTHP